MDFDPVIVILAAIVGLIIIIAKGREIDPDEATRPRYELPPEVIRRLRNK